MKLIFYFKNLDLFFLKFIKKIVKILFKKRKYPLFINLLLTKISYKEFFRERKKYNIQIESNINDYKEIFKQLEYKGYYIIKDYWSKEKCISAIKEINRIINAYPNYVNSKNKSDSRLFGAENLSQVINSFAKDDFLLSIANEYNRRKTSLGFTLAAKMPASKNNKGSGEGWHRDGFFRQFKTLLYLSDVGKNNGPFELIKNSHKFENLIEDIKKGKLGYLQYRLTNSEIKKILVNQTNRKKTIIGNMGTLILVDTSNLHRGSPIKDDIRYALTNYYYTHNQIDSDLYKKFNVVPKNYRKYINEK